MVIKEGARWPDKDGNYKCTYPPDSLIRAKVPAEALPAFSAKAVKHVNDYYQAFVEDLLQKIGAQQEQLDQLQGPVVATAAPTSAASPSAGSCAAALDQERSALEAHLFGVHPGLVTYLGALVELGVDRVDDLSELDEESIESLNLKKLHKAKFLKACGK
jgi:hypothetical protein